MIRKVEKGEPQRFIIPPGGDVTLVNPADSNCDMDYIRADLVQKQIEEAVKDSQAKLDQVTELVEELGEALEDLLDHQNGCPLPKYEIPWNRAVESSRAALGHWRALKDGEK